MLTVYSVSIFFVDTWYGMLAFTLLLIIGVICLQRGRSSVSFIFKLGIPAYIIVALTIIFNALELSDGFLTITSEGLNRGLFFASRILLILLASISVVTSFPLDRMEASIRSILSPFSRLGLPADDIATACSIAIRTIPDSINEYRTIRDAQWSRGAELDTGSIAHRLKAHSMIIGPMSIGIFRNAGRLASAMEARCYGVTRKPRTELHINCIRPSQLSIASVFCCLCIAIALML